MLRTRSLLLVFFVLAASILYVPPGAVPGTAPVKFAGARSSAYGIRPFPSVEGWVKGLKTMASYFPGSTPVGVWIVGRLHGPSKGMSLEFPHPGAANYGDSINFADTDKHEPFLAAFDANGIKVFLQIEPGFADVETGIDLVLERYKRHPSVAGFGIDVEWFRNAKTDNPNAVVTDALAKTWESRVKAQDPKYRLFLKHFRKEDLPPTYRGDIVFVDDSQQFTTLDAFLSEYKEFADFFYPNTVMYQIGYRADKSWWGGMKPPIPKSLGEKLAAQTRQDCGIVWVDFTLRDVVDVD